MARFRLDTIAQLARQMLFAPQDVRAAQIDRAERLLYLLDPAKAYPFEFVLFRITEYRPKTAGQELLTGLALQHDLGLLIEQVSASLKWQTADLAEPVLSIEDVCEKFNVTSKTIQRWRRKGLSARRFIFPDGKQRVGFLLGSVERFLASHSDQVVSANISQVGAEECELMLRHARRLALHCGCSQDEIARRIARRFGRSPLTVLHTLRKHDQEHPQQAVLPLARPGLSDQERNLVIKASRRGIPLGALARRLSCRRSAIYPALIQDRLARLNKRRIGFFDDSLYHQPDAAAVLDQLVAQEDLGQPPRREDLRIPRDLPPYLQALYRIPLLTPGKERALFLKLNHHKYQFVQARRRIEPEQLRHRQLRQLEVCLARVQETKNAIIRANLRLVVSVARKHVRPGVGLLELVSDGNLTLMRAVDSFDVHRGYRFSTYATLALMKGFARSVPAMLAAKRRAAFDPDALAQVPDTRPVSSTTRLIERDEVRRLLDRLDERERSVVCAHFGLDGGAAPATYQQLGQLLGLSKERVRQIEQSALAKLRASLDPAHLQ